jgi:hypothetical protein
MVTILDVGLEMKIKYKNLTDDKVELKLDIWGLLNEAW